MSREAGQDPSNRYPAAPDEGIRILYARLEDLQVKADRGEMAMTGFLTPREAMYARRFLTHRLSGGLALLWGGYGEAERVRAILLPSYVEGLIDPAGLAEHPQAALSEAGFEPLSEAISEDVTILRVCGSGYCTLTHRDFLGAVMGAGLDRDAVGDIIPENDSMALVICSHSISEYLMTALKQVGPDTVRVSQAAPDECPVEYRRTRPVHDTVASERLDCVVAALCMLSRERAQALIRSGLCELDYEAVTNCDRTVSPPAVLSVRGYGKYRVSCFDGENRRGRLRLRAEKYL